MSFFEKKSILVTGGAGFIGSSFVRMALAFGYKIVILDALTYSGRKENINDLLEDSKVHFIHGNILDFELVKKIMLDFKPQYIVNMAAESHVDNSISGPKVFIETNVTGTFTLLEASRFYFNQMNKDDKKLFKFLQVSTDEVFGSLGSQGKFQESTAYRPRSPYSATKASADHLVQSWQHTYGLPSLITNCSNNYGPRQFPEKLIPLMIKNALLDQDLPVYGKGENIRDWIFVDDHSRGILLALEKGISGESYCFGGNSERTNLQVVETLCHILDRLSPKTNRLSYKNQIRFVADRPGHDWRYAIDDQRAQNELGFQRTIKNFEEGLEKTIKWYLDNHDWLQKASK